MSGRRRNQNSGPLKALIDTNILIPLEDTSRLLDPQMAEMRRLAEEAGLVLCIHPAQREDVRRDSNEERRNILLSRMDMYQELQSPPNLTPDDLERYDWRQTSANDRVDNLLLHALCWGSVHFLVTNDNEIHKKAQQVGQGHIKEAVHRLDQFLAYLRKKTASAREAPPAPQFQTRALCEIDPRQHFFDSLREGYPGFDEWYRKVQKAGREAWCIFQKESLVAICIFKREAPEKIADGKEPLDGEALKLCTFKVSEEARGQKLGERLLYMAFHHADAQGIPYVYMHVYGREHEMLVSLCEEYGFSHYGQRGNGDDVYVKPMQTPVQPSSEDNPLAYATRHYPHFLDTSKVQKFIIPIEPEYHNILFADATGNPGSVFGTLPPSNAIKKAYLCHAKTKHIRPGDLLFFYRSADRKSSDCMGIVERTLRSQEASQILPLVSKRTVFSDENIRDMLDKEVLVILFRFIRNFPPVTSDALQDAGVRGPIQTIRKIGHEQYQNCFRRALG